MITIKGYTNGVIRDPLNSNEFIEYPVVIRRFKRKGLRFKLCLFKFKILFDYIEIVQEDEQ